MQLHPRATIQQSRASLHQEPNCKFIDFDEFLALAVSTRRLYRADAGDAAMRGLLDPATGTRYLTAEEVFERDDWCLRGHD